MTGNANLYRDPHYTFRFEDDRLVPRFHLEGVEPGVRVTVFEIAPDGGRGRVLAKAVVGDGGWVDLREPLAARAGGGFVAVPHPAVVVRPETADDFEAIRIVNRLAFGQDDESRLVDQLREGGFVRVSLVAVCGGRVAGHILFSDLPIVTDTGTVPSLALAPMAVLPEFQNQGVGSVLVSRGLEACREQGHRIVVVLGHAAYYPRFGFSTEEAGPLDSPFGGRESFMALALVPGALDGVKGRVVYAPPFGAWT